MTPPLPTSPPPTPPLPRAFVCEKCDLEVATGLMACPQCGQAFDTPVPDPATYREPGPSLAPDPMPVPLPRMPAADRNGLSVGVFLTLIALACLVWLAHNGAFSPGGGYLPAH